jgi:hypothetical protein
VLRTVVRGQESVRRGACTSAVGEVVASKARDTNGPRRIRVGVGRDVVGAVRAPTRFFRNGLRSQVLSFGRHCAKIRVGQHLHPALLIPKDRSSVPFLPARVRGHQFHSMAAAVK